MIRKLSAGLFTSAALLCENSSSQVYQDALKSVFCISFVDTEKGAVKGTCSGFFITNDGLGITSGPFARAFHQNSAVLKFSDGREMDCAVSFNKAVPGFAFVQVRGQPNEKLMISEKEIREGEDVYLCAMKEKHGFFSKLFVTDKEHKWIEFRDGVLMNTPVFRMTGLVPKESFGAPLMDLDGKVVGIVSHIENGLGIGYSIKYLKEMYKEEGSKMYQAWEKIRDGIMGKFRSFIE